MSEVLRLTDVSYVRNGRVILNEVNWAAQSSERWVILGPNGAGKSSILKIVSGNDYPTSGEVQILDERLGKVDVFQLRSRIGLAAREHERRIPFRETVLDVVLTAAYAVMGRWNENYDALDVRQADRVLSEWQLEDLADRRFGTLSDGERKRVMIARAVMTDPELLLLDEPAASLDLGARERLIRLLAGYASSPTSPAMVMVTHHVEEIPKGFTHLLLLNASGEVVAQGPLADTLTAENLERAFGLPFDLSVSDHRYAAVAHVGNVE